MVKCEECGREALFIVGAPEMSWVFECEVCQTGRWYWVGLDKLANDTRGVIDHVEEKNWVGPEFREKVNQYIK